ncbi:Ribonuclease/ribotoxin [Schizophyllum amplum]|uniref:Ribonuclease/ribotoxin n=1 Tax=Schizophyllum amplum TaxID=97359 RepID=A0A550C406_9AGAR|nr:Ribonuclease/ribotoxin [Auriculariopsis ampla]
MLVLFALAAVASASVIPRAWPSGTVTCGSHKYSLSQVKAAVAQGIKYEDNPVGSNSYPHTFNNYEGLKMWCTGESDYNEFPILSSGSLYTGSSPGADRVIFSDNGVYCAVVTHTGASGNNFVSCSGD